MQGKEDSHSEDGNTPLSCMWTLVDRDWQNLGEEHHGGSTQTVAGASVGVSVGVADTALEVDEASSSLRDRPHNEHNTGSVETDDLQGANQTEPVVNTSDSDEPPLPIAESSGQTLASVTVSALSLPDIGEDDPVMVDISNAVVKVLDEQLSPSGVKYRCELEPLWLAADLVEKAKMGHVHIRNYKNDLIRANRLRTLRKGKKRKLSQM